MSVIIRYRLDTAEFFETDANVLRDTTWEQVFREVTAIEAAACTVLSIERVIE
jgi:hypothetical protein